MGPSTLIYSEHNNKNRFLIKQQTQKESSIQKETFWFVLFFVFLCLSKRKSMTEIRGARIY